MIRLLVAGLALAGVAADWPQILGPNRDGQSAETGLNWAWAANPPKTIWQKPVGTGWAGPAVANGKLFLFHRVGTDDVLAALDPATGTEIWTYRRPSKYTDDFGQNDGPRATPTVAGDTVYTLGANGTLCAVAVADGSLRWSRDLRTEYKAGKGYFGFACSPLVADGKVILNVGGKAAGIVAWEAATGKQLWAATDDEASYSSPVVADVAGQPTVLAFTRRGLVALELATGAKRFDKFWRSRIDASVNAAVPLLVDGNIFLTASYATGAILLKPTATGEPTEVWSNDKSLSCQYTTPVRVGDHLFGTDGRADFGTGQLRCVETATGAVKWSQERFGCAHLIAVDGKLLAVTESGDVVAITASADGYTELGRLSVLSGKVRALPALASGRLYLRDDDKLVAIILTK